MDASTPGDGTALTAALGAFVSALALESVPPEVQAIAKTGFTDCFGVMVAGARDPVVALIDRELSGAGGTELASLVPSGARRGTADAALVNGIAAHVLDYDDVTLDGHPSAVLVPAILAQAEASGANGAEMLAAYVAGYEVWVELLIREPVPLYQKGWHPTAVRGTVAAAAACARLRHLDGAATATALAVAASMASGVVANFGTLTKSFQVGRAAQSGVLAARLAAAGLTAAPDALEHRSGLLMALSPGTPDLGRPFDPAARPWHLARQGLNVKRYPVCYGAHRAIDAAIDLAQRHDLRPGDIDRIDVAIGAMQMLMMRNDRPQTGFEAKFSLPFAMAAAIVARNVGLAQLTDAFVQVPQVQALFPRVAATTTTEQMQASAFSPSETVAIRTLRGDVFTSDPVVHARGSHERPLSREELWVKFSDCLGEGVPRGSAERAFERLQTLERLNDAGTLLQLQ